MAEAKKPTSAKQAAYMLDGLDLTEDEKLFATDLSLLAGVFHAAEKTCPTSS